ncbi:MAG: nucleotidyltransferase domain-containing protein [Phycisphaerae bacterium]
MTDTDRDRVLHELIQRIAERFRPEMIILFGSYARGQATSDSDLDLLVVMEVNGSCRQKANEIDLALPDRTIPMDLIVLTPRQFERQKHLVGTIAREAFRKGRILYDRAA